MRVVADAMLDPELKRFVDAAIVPALLERFLREHQAGMRRPAPTAALTDDFPRPEASV